MTVGEAFLTTPRLTLQYGFINEIIEISETTETNSPWA